MSDKTRIGFVGSGGIARHHCNRIRQFDDAEIAGFYDVDPSRAEGHAASFGGVAFKSLDAMLADDSIDAAFLCIPPFAHGETDEKIIRSGKALFVEKPVAIDAETGKRLHEMILEAGMVTSVGYHFRYMSTTDHAKQALGDEPVLGALGYWLGGLVGLTWWRHKAESGGQIVEQATHIYDLASYFIGAKPVSVYARGQSGILRSEYPDHDIEDISCVTVNYDNGAFANIWTGDVFEGQAGRVGLQLMARDVRLEVRDAEVTIWDTEGMRRLPRKNDPYVDEDRAFIDAVRAGDSSALRSTYQTGYESFCVTLAANRALESGREEAVVL